MHSKAPGVRNSLRYQFAHTQSHREGNKKEVVDLALCSLQSSAAQARPRAVLCNTNDHCIRPIDAHRLTFSMPVPFVQN
jgi:hypothetical protein